MNDPTGPGAASVPPSDEIGVDLTVNGEKHRLRVPSCRLLADVIREDLGLTGTHLGCEHGICGACTVLVDGESARSCITLAVQVDGSEVTTVEGLAPFGELGPMQQAFKDNHGLQCGFCTPGFLMTLAGTDPADHPCTADVRGVLSGNICRCTGYQHIVDAVEQGWGRRPAPNVSDGETATP